MFYIWKVAICALCAVRVSSLVCNSECIRENNCAVPSTTSPLPVADTPQFVTLTFDDALTQHLKTEYLSPLFADRFNPDGKPITASFYFPHPYTDYIVVNELYNQGHDISFNSISKGPARYWRTATAEQIQMDFEHNCKVAQRFAQLPKDRVFGARIPHLELAGDTTFTGYKNQKVLYDNSCVVSSYNPLFPFTLDCTSNQTCFVGRLPKKSYPGLWVMPIISLRGANNYQCNALAACGIHGSAVQISDWLKEQFLRLFNNNRAPMTLMLSTMFFRTVENSFEGLQLFLDYLADIPQVYVVSHQDVMNWSKNPIALASYFRNYTTHSMPCTPVTDCVYMYDNHERLFHNCNFCPEVYPTLGNPGGYASV